MTPLAASIIGFIAGTVGTLAIALLVRRKHRAAFLAESTQLRVEIENIEKETDRKIRIARDEFEEKGLIQAKHLAQVIKSRYALTSQTTRLILEILDFDGNSTMTRIHRGLRTSEGLNLSYMQHHFDCSTPGGLIREVALVPAGSSDGVGLEIVEKKPTAVAFHILFPNNITSIADGVNYEYRVSVERGILMTKEEADIAYADDESQQEGMFHDNDIPTKLLELEVIFPHNYPARCSCHVYIGGSWIPHIEETKKLELQDTGRGAKLTIENPIHGFRYLIDWLAPTREEFQGIKRKSSENGMVAASG